MKIKRDKVLKNDKGKGTLSKKSIGIKKNKTENIKAKSMKLVNQVNLTTKTTEKQIPKLKKPKGFVVSTVKNSDQVTKLKPKVSGELDGQTIGTEKVDNAVKALYKICKSYQEKSKGNLFNDSECVLLQVSLIKVPRVNEMRRKYLSLHHTFYSNEPELCLFVDNKYPTDGLKRSDDEIIDFSVQFYEEYFKTHGIDCVSSVVPVKQLANEYSTYELKRKLVNKFDVFGVQANLLKSGVFTKITGKPFLKKNKYPLPVQFTTKVNEPDEQFRERIQKLLLTTWFYLKPYSDTLSIRVGNINLTEEELSENVRYILTQIQGNDVIPGNVSNIRSIFLKTARSPPVPIYINLVKGNKVKLVPVVPSLKTKRKAVEEDLSTMPGKRVIVFPTGRVILKNDPNESADSDTETKSKKQKNDVEKKQKKKNKETPKGQNSSVPKKLNKQEKKSINVNPKNIVKGKKKKGSKFSDSESSDDEIDAAEEKYLATLE